MTINLLAIIISSCLLYDNAISKREGSLSVFVTPQDFQKNNFFVLYELM